MSEMATEVFKKQLIAMNDIAEAYGRVPLKKYNHGTQHNRHAST
jgi:hypothetical protein